MFAHRGAWFPLWKIRRGVEGQHTYWRREICGTFFFGGGGEETPYHYSSPPPLLRKKLLHNNSARDYDWRWDFLNYVPAPILIIFAKFIVERGNRPRPGTLVISSVLISPSRLREYTALLWQKEASHKRGISCKRAKCVCLT